MIECPHHDESRSIPVDHMNSKGEENEYCQSTKDGTASDGSHWKKGTGREWRSDGE